MKNDTAWCSERAPRCVVLMVVFSIYSIVYSLAFLKPAMLKYF